MANIDEIMERLERGDTLMIDDQLRSYISIESGDMPKRFVMHSVQASIEDAEIKGQAPICFDYEVQRFASLAEALLSLTDYQWRGIGQGKASNEQ